MDKLKSLFDKKKQHHSFRTLKNPILDESMVNVFDESRSKLKSKSIEKKEARPTKQIPKLNGIITKKQIIENKHNKKLITALLSLKNSTKLVSASFEGILCIYNFDKNKKEFQIEESFNGHNEKITSLCKQKEVNQFLSSSLDCLIKQWDVDNYQCIFTIRVNSPVINMIILKENKILAALENQTMIEWNDEGKIFGKMDAHNKLVHHMVEINENLLVTNDSKSTLHFWDIQYCMYVYFVTSHDPIVGIRSIFYEEESNQLLIGGKGDLAIFDLKLKKIIHKVYIGFSGNIMSLIKLYDDNYIAGMWLTDCQIIHINKSFKKLNTFEKMINFFSLPSTTVIFYPFSQAINCAILYENTNLFIIGDTGGNIISWEY